MTSERAVEPQKTEELRLGQLICEGSNHDHEWAVCRASETVALYLLPRLAATPAPREDGWEELRREIEALHGWRVEDDYQVSQAAVLAIVDRLAAARGEPGLDVERLDATFTEMGQRGWVLVPDGHSPATVRNVFLEAYARLVPSAEPPETET